MSCYCRRARQLNLSWAGCIEPSWASMWLFILLSICRRFLGLQVRRYHTSTCPFPLTGSTLHVHVAE